MQLALYSLGFFNPRIKPKSIHPGMMNHVTVLPFIVFI